MFQKKLKISLSPDFSPHVPTQDDNIRFEMDEACSTRGEMKNVHTILFRKP
jgi:hypothetical protein